MIYRSWNGSCIIWVSEQLSDGRTRKNKSSRWSVMVKWHPTPPKIEKNKFVLKCILGHFQCFEQFLFLVENWPILLVENSTNFFKPSLTQWVSLKKLSKLNPTSNCTVQKKYEKAKNQLTPANKKLCSNYSLSLLLTKFVAFKTDINEFICLANFERSDSELDLI